MNIENVYHDVKATNDQKLKEKLSKEPDKDVSYRILHNFNYDYSKKDANYKDYLAVAEAEPEFDSYEPFKGICFTDTFQLYEKGDPSLNDEVFRENSKRVDIQKQTPITVIIGNPPYSEGQDSENDNAKNQKYEFLDEKIRNTYAKLSNRKLKKGVYNSYIRAFRWATDRLAKSSNGLILFITNAGWITNSNTDGLRKCFEKDFQNIYILNLRGDIKGRIGEDAKREGQNVFDIMNGVAITILVKTSKKQKCKIYYAALEDYLQKKEKLYFLSHSMSIKTILPNFITIQPENGDWLAKGNSKFKTFISIGEKSKTSENSFFEIYSGGLLTSRDLWCYNFSEKELENNINKTINFYNSQLSKFPNVSYDNEKISWSRALLSKAKNGKKIIFEKNDITLACYRPFAKVFAYFNKDLNEVNYQNRLFFPKNGKENYIITISGSGGVHGLSILMCNTIRDFGTYGGCQCFPLYWYEEVNHKNPLLFDDGNENYIRHDAVSDFILNRAQGKYGNKVTKEDIFYYVYGLLHSKSYRETFAADLKKMLPRIPLVSDYKKFFAFVDAGKKLAALHLNYENQPALNEVQIQGDLTRNDYEYFEVQQMAFIKKDDKSAIRYNNNITVSNIPQKAYDYILNGQSAIEHVMEWYGSKKWNSQAKKSGSGIVNDPNDWSHEHSKPRYILDLLLSVINVSVQTVDIVNSLPEVDWEKE